MSTRNEVTVGDAMSGAAIHVDGLATVKQALDLMAREGVNALVIERRDAGDEYGLLSISSIAAEVIARGRALERVNVYEIMDKPALTVETAMKARYAIRLLTRHGLTRALATEDGELRGLVSLRDLSTAFAAAAPDPL